MAKILGEIPNSLARILDIEGGRVLVDELRDVEGIALVYDVSRLTAAELFSQQSRNFDTGNVTQSANSIQLIEGVPILHRTIGVNINTDDASRLAQVAVTVQQIGGIGGGSDNLIWYWEAGDTTIVRPSGMTVGSIALATVLLPSFTQSFPVPFTQKEAAVSRVGSLRYRIIVTTAAFGAGNVRVSGSLIQDFWIGLGGRAVATTPPY